MHGTGYSLLDQAVEINVTIKFLLSWKWTVRNFKTENRCEEECYRRGNCCQDFEEECPQFVFWK